MKNILITCIGCAPASAIARSLNKEYNIYGIDTQEICVGSFICQTFITFTYQFNTNEYWNAIENIISTKKIDGIFVVLPHEILEWSKRKQQYMNQYKCEIYLNEPELIEIANCKNNTYNFCIDNNINIPLKKVITERPIIIKPVDGCGSNGIQILKTYEDNAIPFDKNNIIQEFITGDEYTVDIISDNNGNIISIIPKKRLLIKNGQAFKSIIINNDDVISFIRDVCLKLNNKSSINIQVIQEKDTGKIYLIEINPRFGTTISLSIESGVHIPKMLIEHDYNEYEIKYNLLMVRDYKEYFLNDNIKYPNINNIIERNCLTCPNDKHITASDIDNEHFKLLRKNIDKFLLSMYEYLKTKKNILEIGEYWYPYKGAKNIYPNLNIKSLDLNNDLKPDYCMDITTKTDFSDNYFDSIICLEVLEHTENPFNAIEEITRILRTDGLLFISVPCNYRIHSPLPDSFRFTEHFFKVIAKNYNYKLLELKCIENSERLLFPIHYTCIMIKL